MSVIQTLYPATSTVALTCDVAGLASDSGLIVGRAGTAVSNDSNLDEDHLLSGFITVGTTPTVGKSIELWIYAPQSVATGTPTYPEAITGTDAGKTITSLNVKLAALHHALTITVDATTDRKYAFKPISIVKVVGSMPRFWGPFVVHDTVAALKTGANHSFVYERVQRQVT